MTVLSKYIILSTASLALLSVDIVCGAGQADQNVVLDLPAEYSHYLKEIEDLVAQMERLSVEGKPDQLGMLYSEYSDLIALRAPRIRGRKAIAGYWASWLGSLDGLDVQLTVDVMRIIDPDVALVEVSSKRSGTASSGDKVEMRDMRETLVLARTDKGWIIEAHRILSDKDEGMEIPSPAESTE